jgi:hypothetical protein
LTHTYFAAALCLIIALHAPHSEGAQTQRTQAEGVAAIGASGRDEARQAALRDALRQAALSVESQVEGTERLNAANVPLQSLHVRPTQQVTHYSILREWEDQGLYHVTVSAEVGQGKVAAECATRAHAPKKKVAFIPFGVANSIQVDDINNILDGLPSELSRRLEASGEFLPIYVLRSIPREDNTPQREAVMRIAKESGAQFLVSGTIVDAGASQGSPGIFGTLLGRSRKRHFEIEFTVYDGLTGTRILLRRLDEVAEGDVMVGRDKPFGSRVFFETEFGQAANRLVDDATKEIRAALECLPFSANIVRVEGNKVFLDAGGTSLLRPGDKLIAYSRDFYHPTVGLGNTGALGVQERPVATVTLIQIQPRFSIGDLPEDTSKLGINVGDTVRFEFVDNTGGPTL